MAAADDLELSSRKSVQRAVTAVHNQVRSDEWREHQARENEIKRALLPLLDGNAEEVERVFLIIKQQREY